MASPIEQLGHCVAVEIDLYSDRAGGVDMLRLCNFGPLFSSTTLEQYQAKLSDAAIAVGTSISISSYGQPMRALSNQGRIAFAIDDEIYPYLGADYHWIGVEFRVYQGALQPGNWREDLALVYVGRVTNLTHDTRVATVQLGDASVDLDVPIIDEMYPTVAPDSGDLAGENIANTPKPQVWGSVICVQPVLIDSANFVYDVSPLTGLTAVNEVRIGDIPWEASGSYPPAAGTFYANLPAGTIQLGSDPLGGDVRVDAQGVPVAGVGDLVRKIAAKFGVPADDTAINYVDQTLALAVGYYLDNTSVNALNVLDDIVTGAGAYWGIDNFGKIIVGIVAAPAGVADIDTPATYDNVVSIQLSQMLPPVWRLKLEYERHWQPAGTPFGAVLAEDQQRWRSTGRTISKEDASIKTAEPRAFDVPALRSVATFLANANEVLNQLWLAWSVPRRGYNITLWIDPSTIGLYRTINVDYHPVSGNFRVLSAVPAIGGGPATLIVWG
jgi:hypothetical protein